jgi:hypothetical protein
MFCQTKEIEQTISKISIYIMDDQFKLTVEVDQNPTEIFYHLADNPIAHSWFKKIRHLQHVPFDPFYSTGYLPKINSVTELNSVITDYLTKISKETGLSLPISTTYTQHQCNQLHSLVVEYQYQYNIEVRNLFHYVHRKIHDLEEILINQQKYPYLVKAHWGEKDSLLHSSFPADPYQWYETKMTQGSLYLVWIEFGKTPHGYWKDQDLDSFEHFFQTCCPMKTFSAAFALCQQNIQCNDPFEPEFETWFDRYRPEWIRRYGHDWLPEYSRSGVLLAEPLTQIDYSKINQISKIQTI